MIAFQTLLLGLVLGSTPVTVMVAPEVHAVEFLLDGESLGTIVGPPWTVAVDFGADPHPHELLAIARDLHGNELGRARQSVNLPHPDAEVEILLEHAAGSPRITSVRLTWDDVKLAKPRRISPSLDGKALPVGDETTFPLPEYDAKQAHVLTVEVQFPERRRASAQVAFGGELAEQARTELTAVPVTPDPGYELPGAAGMRDWFTEDRRRLTVAAVERGPAEVVLVVDPGAQGLMTPARASHKVARFLFGARFVLPQRPDDDLLFISSPLVRNYAGATGTTRGLFTLLGPYRLELSHFASRLARGRFSQPGPATQLATAVATAGLEATRLNHRRAVVVLLGEPAHDESDLTVCAARRFLEDLHVPLLVWSTAPASETAKAWGPVEDASSENLLDRAASRLGEALARQRIVWIEGAHLPQRITLTDKARGIRIAE